jgi:hypothetical protein
MYAFTENICLSVRLSISVCCQEYVTMEFGKKVCSRRHRTLRPEGSQLETDFFLLICNLFVMLSIAQIIQHRLMG